MQNQERQLKMVTRMVSGMVVTIAGRKGNRDRSRQESAKCLKAYDIEVTSEDRNDIDLIVHYAGKRQWPDHVKKIYHRGAPTLNIGDLLYAVWESQFSSDVNSPARIERTYNAFVEILAWRRRRMGLALEDGSVDRMRMLEPAGLRLVGTPAAGMLIDF